MNRPPYPPPLDRVPDGPSTREERSAWVEARRVFRTAWHAEQAQRDDVCQYAEPWGGPCYEPTPCPRHAHLRCHCGAVATAGCEETGALVCGRPLCDDHGPRCRLH